MPVILTEPELTLLSGTVLDEDGNETTAIYPTLRTPETYRRNGYRFHARLQDPFEWRNDEKMLGLMMMIRGRPIPEARPATGRNGNVFVPTRGARLELASTIRNLLFEEFHHHPQEFRSHRAIKMFATFAYPSGTNSNSVGDVDNLTKFTKDALEAAGVIANDRDIETDCCDRVVDHPAGSMTEMLATTGGIIIILKVKKQQHSA